MLNSDSKNCSINYIIATHASNTLRRKSMGDLYSSSVLRYHFYILSELLDSSSNIKTITIVKPKVEDNIGYYNISPYDQILESKGIKIVHYDVEDKGISYTQYLKCFLNYQDYDYYYITEDDYTINLNYKNFDKILLELYQNNFMDDIGFLNAWSPIEGLHRLPFHSAITLGILSKNSVKSIINNIENVYVDQFEFSRLIIVKNIPIKDMTQVGFKTRILYWSTGNNRIEDYSLADCENCFFTPIQYYYDHVNFFIKRKNQIISIKNQYKLHEK